MRAFVPALLLLAACSTEAKYTSSSKEVKLLNVSYDPTRELYRELNEQFVAKWLADKGQTVSVPMSHGGSGSQARAVIDGLDGKLEWLPLNRDVGAYGKRICGDRCSWRVLGVGRVLAGRSGWDGRWRGARVTACRDCGHQNDGTRELENAHGSPPPPYRKLGCLGRCESGANRLQANREGYQRGERYAPPQAQSRST